MTRSTFPNDESIEHIQFEVTVAATDSRSDVVSHDLGADHSH